MKSLGFWDQIAAKTFSRFRKLGSNEPLWKVLGDWINYLYHVKYDEEIEYQIIDQSIPHDYF